MHKQINICIYICKL